jgi:hypothetical protein
MTDEKKPPMKGEDWKVEFSDQVKEAMENDPKIKEGVTEFLAAWRQATELLNTGKYASMEDALRALGFEGGPVDEDLH